MAIFYGTRGPDKWVPTDDELERIEKLASLGLNVDQIGYMFNVGRRTIERRANEMPELRNALTAGRAKGAADLAHTAYKMAKKGDVRMLKFLLERKHGFTLDNPNDIDDEEDYPDV